MKLNIATVFSGIGSFEYALKRLDIEHNIVFACDNGEIDDGLEIDEEEVRILVKNEKDPLLKKKIVDDIYSKSRKTNFVKQSYFANYEISNDKWHQDIRFVDGSVYNNQVDILVGGSPCQSFSIMGYQKGLDDTRGTLFYDFARLVDEIQPKVFIYENVQGLTKHDKGNTWNIMKGVFKDLNYTTHESILDAVEYGVPQKRRRIFVIGINDNLIQEENVNKFEFPLPVPLKHTLQDFLIESVAKGNFNSLNGEIQLLPVGGEVEKKYILSDKVKAHVMSPGTKSYYTKPEIDLPIARPLLSTMHKMHRAGVDNYITVSKEEGLIRKLTPRECLRLMGFDDSFKIVVSNTQAYRQAGNSIVVNVFIYLIKELLKQEFFSPSVEDSKLVSIK